MKYYLPLLVILCLPIATKCQEPITKIFIARHADRQGQADDLSAPGVKRAAELKRVLGLVKIDSIFSTNTIRTKKTVEPLATLKNLPIRTYLDIPTIIKHIMLNCKGKTVLVVAHSDTVDDLIRECGCKAPSSIDPNMPATEYDNLFVVHFSAKGDATVIHMKYGD